MNFLRQIFVWWRGQTFGTRLHTFFFGRRMGKDEAGNIYYRHRSRDSYRWVIYHGMIDASKIPPEWHAWLHNMRRNPPVSADQKDSQKDPQEDYSWLRPPIANLTGTAKAFRRQAGTVDEQTQELGTEYEAWVPSGTPPNKNNVKDGG